MAPPRDPRIGESQKPAQVHVCQDWPASRTSHDHNPRHYWQERTVKRLQLRVKLLKHRFEVKLDSPNLDKIEKKSPDSFFAHYIVFNCIEVSDVDAWVNGPRLTQDIVKILIYKKHCLPTVWKPLYDLLIRQIYICLTFTVVHAQG